MDVADPLRALLPQPKSVRPLPGVCRVDGPIRVTSTVADARIRPILDAWADGRTGLVPPNTAVGGGTASPRNTTPVVLEVHIDAGAPTANGHDQSYRLECAPDRIRIAARTVQGCWYALETLRVLAGIPHESAASVPCCVIDDQPDFDTRGVLLDITRGRVPTLARLKSLIDRLARLKVNQVQLYIEHAFVFSFDPDICDADSGITPDEVRELDAYCRERFIDLVPAVATLGHMGRILSLPRYRHLAEIAPECAWEALDWPARARGFTLDCANPESRRLVERIWSNILDAFASPVVNICGDEPWDLGRGRNAGRWDDRRRGEVYLEHIRRTHEICSSRGRRTMFWSDVVAKYPELFDRVPRGSTVLHWGYDDKAEYAATRRFTESGLETFVCPGTSGWKRIINAMDLAERNIKSFADAGRTCGATGLINTDWGDHGHFNMPACSWHAQVLGAALGWSAKHGTGELFDQALARSWMGCDDAALFRALRKASAVGAQCETWPMLYRPVARIRTEADLPTYKAAGHALEAAQQAEKLCRSLETNDTATQQDLAELALACRFSACCASKLLMIHALSSGGPSADDPAREARRWQDHIKACTDQYARLWRSGNKGSGLADIITALDQAGVDLVQAVTA